MIPYDDLVAALANWRAKQGLPSGALGAPAPVAAAPSAPASKSGPKVAPPAARASAAATLDEPYDVDESALLEEAAYGDELGAAFDNAMGNEEATAIGGAPSVDATIDEAMPRGGSGGAKKSGSGPAKSGGKKKSSDW